MVDDDANGSITVISEQDAQTILDKQVNVVNHIRSQGLNTIRTIFAVVAIIATLIAAGLNILIIPVAQPGQTSNFNQAVNPSDVPRGVLAFTTFTAIVEHFISLIIFIVLLLDSMCVLWGPVSPANLQPQMGATLSRKSSTLVESETAALIENGGVDLQYSSRLD
jgi:hypothetical protein